MGFENLRKTDEMYKKMDIVEGKGCGKKIYAFGDIIVCGGVDDWICPDCEKIKLNIVKE